MKFISRIDDELNLVFLDESYAKDLYKIVDEERDYLSQWLSWPPSMKSEEDFKSYIKRSIYSYSEGRSACYIIEYKGSIAGLIHKRNIIRELKKVEVGYWISSRYQGNGVVTRGLKYLVEDIFKGSDIEKIEAAVATENLKSQKVCKSLGFVEEGRIKNSENLHGKIIDHVIFGLYRD